MWERVWKSSFSFCYHYRHQKHHSRCDKLVKPEVTIFFLIAIMTSNTTDITIDTHQLHYQHWYNMKFTSSTSSPSLATDTTAKVRISITIINIGLSVTIYHGRTGLPIGTHVTANVDKIVHMIFEVHCSKHISICFNLFFWKNLLPGGNLVNTYMTRCMVI